MMKLIVLTVLLAVLSVAFAGLGDSLGDVVSSFRSATKDHVCALFPFLSHPTDCVNEQCAVPANIDFMQ